MADLRQYLIERFESDASTLRARADMLDQNALTKNAEPQPGPEGATSRAMADACDEVVKLANALPENAPLELMLEKLQALAPTLMMRANTPALVKSPMVKSVFVGAAARVKELIAAELAALPQSARSPNPS